MKRELRILTLPHDFSIEGEYDRLNPSGKKGAFLPSGIAWYRKIFLNDGDNTEKYCYITFDGVYHNSEIYLNGVKIHDNPYGNNTFTVDLTEHIKIGENVLAVRVDDSKLSSSGWYNGAGIYRNMWLNYKNKAHFFNDFFIYTKEISENQAVLSVTVNSEYVSNKTKVTLSFADKVLFEKEFFSANITAEIKVEELKLWTFLQPDLYQ